jgi:hypothetical protein
MAKRSAIRWSISFAVVVGSTMATNSHSLAYERDDHWSDIDAAEFQAEPLSAETTSSEFGRFEVAGDFFNSAVVIPGAKAAVAFDLTDRRLVRYDLETNDIIRSDRRLIEGTVPQLIASPGGTWILVLVQSSPSNSVQRFRATDLSFESEFPLRNDVTPQLKTVPDDDALIISRIPGGLEVLRDGGALPDRVELPVFIWDAAIFPGNIGIASATDGLYQFSVGPTGLTDLTKRSDIVGSTINPSGPAEFVLSNDTVFDIATLTPRPVTEFDLGLIDPTEPYRYAAQIYDKTTREPVIAGRICEQSFRRTNEWEAVGDGWLVNDRLEFMNVIGRCGALGEFTALAPRRIFDSRSGSGYAGDGLPLTAGSTRRVKFMASGASPSRESTP